MTEQKQDRERKRDRDEMDADTQPRDRSSREVDFNGHDRSGDLQKQGEGSDSSGGNFSQWEDSRMLVPSSLELGPWRC